MLLSMISDLHNLVLDARMALGNIKSFLEEHNLDIVNFDCVLKHFDFIKGYVACYYDLCLPPTDKGRDTTRCQQ